MPQRDRVFSRQIDRALTAGRRWQQLTARRAETVRRLKAGGPEAADTPSRVQLYLAREEAKQLAYARAGVTSAFFAERQIGPTLDLDETPPNEAARLAGIPVGRIVDLDSSGSVRDGFATGFLVSPRLMLTNHHVFASPEECRNCGIQFGYEKVNGSLAAGVVFSLDTNLFFYANEELDFALVGVSSSSITGSVPLAQLSTLGLIPTTGKILVGQPVSIIQYPDGGPKKYGVRDNELLIAPADTDLFLQYTTDTLPGSSGSPAFNKDWEVVALHHSGVPEVKDGQIMTIRGTPWSKGMPDSDIHWVANEGVRVSCICKNLASAQVKPEYQVSLANLLSTFGEDFSKLPAIQSQTEINSMDAPNTSRGVSISVSGTANFYFDKAAQSAGDSAIAVAVAPVVKAPVAVEKKLRFDPDYTHRPGFKTNFLGVSTPLPGVAKARAKELLMEGTKPRVLKYHHYSLVMNHARRLQMWSAVNVDYTPSKRRKARADFGTDTWVADPRIPGIEQIEDQELYSPAAKFDRGHIVRREDTAWGDTALDEVFANSDSFHWTNCTPQHEQFNRAMFQYHGLWGELENHILAQAKNVGNKMSIFAGPVLDDKNDIRHDFGGGEVKIPRRFWKVVLAVEDADTAKANLRAYAFILDQSEAIKKYGLERFSVGEFDTYQVALADLTDATGVTFDNTIENADALSGAPEESKRVRLESLSDVRL